MSEQRTWSLFTDRYVNGFFPTFLAYLAYLILHPLSCYKRKHLFTIITFALQKNHVKYLKKLLFNYFTQPYVSIKTV